MFMLIGSGEPRLKNYFQIPFATLIKQSSSMYVASLKTKRSCRINLQHLQDLNLIHLRIIGLISIWMKKPHTKKCKKQTRKLNQSGKINEKVRRLPNGTFIIALSLLELIQKIFKTREKFQSHFINYSYQMGDVSFIIYKQGKKYN